MTFLAAAAAAPFPADADHTTYRMPDSPRLVDPAPVQDPALTRVEVVDADQAAAAPTSPAIFAPQVCERCGTFLAPAVTRCPVCTGQCGGPCCTGGTR